MQKLVEAKPRMVRKQVYLTADQDRQLKALSKARHVAAAELIRSAVDVLLQKDDEAEQLAQWKASVNKAAGIWQDRDDLDEVFSDMRKGWDRRLKRMGLLPDEPK